MIIEIFIVDASALLGRSVNVHFNYLTLIGNSRRESSAWIFKKKVRH